MGRGLPNEVQAESEVGMAKSEHRVPLLGIDRLLIGEPASAFKIQSSDRAGC